MRRAPVLLALMLTAGPAAAPAADYDPGHVRYQIWAADSLPLHGRYFPPAAPDAPLVLLLHGRRGRGDDWRSLAELLQERGAASLLPDLRGCGRSVRAPRRARAAPPRWNAAFRALLAEDLAALSAFADRQPALAGRRRVLVATGESAGLALALFAADPRWTRLALLSPLLAEDAPPPPALERPVLLVSCEGDREAVLAARRLAKEVPPALRQVEYPACSSRGTRMLRWLPSLGGRLADWILQ